MSRKISPRCNSNENYHANHVCETCASYDRSQRAPHTTTVGARRSIRFTPAPLGARLGNGALSEDQQQNLALMATVDHAVYHAPLDTAPRKARKSKSAPLAASLKSGESAMGADDLKACKRPMAAVIPYETADGEVVAAIFGGLTMQQAESAVSGNGGWTTTAAKADAISDGAKITNMRGGRTFRAVLWHSEMQRRGALPVEMTDFPTESILLAA